MTDTSATGRTADEFLSASRSLGFGQKRGSRITDREIGWGTRRQKEERGRGIFRCCALHCIAIENEIAGPFFPYTRPGMMALDRLAAEAAEALYIEISFVVSAAVE